MKLKWIVLLLVLAACAAAGVHRWPRHHQTLTDMLHSDGRKALYYTCAMHPWVRETKPGPCPVCGMDLTPVFAGEDTTNASPDSGIVTLEPDSISTINVQTDPVEHQPVRRSIHLSGQISWNSAQAAWFEFTVYQRDLEWLKTGQELDVSVTGVPDKTYTAEIKEHGIKPFIDTDFNMMTSSTTVRAEISDGPVRVGDLGRQRLLNGLHAEAHLVAETEPTLVIPRTAIISRGLGPMVYVQQSNGHYAPRTIKLGRIGDQVAEVLDGLKAGERVVTTGNILIDSEAQLVAGQ